MIDLIYRKLTPYSLSIIINTFWCWGRSRKKAIDSIPLSLGYNGRLNFVCFLDFIILGSQPPPPAEGLSALLTRCLYILITKVRLIQYFSSSSIVNFPSISGNVRHGFLFNVKPSHGTSASWYHSMQWSTKSQGLTMNTLEAPTSSASSRSSGK